MGRRHTLVTRIKMSVNHADVSGEKNPNYGKRFSNKSKTKMSKAQKGNKYCLGRKLSEETKSKIGEAQMGRHHTEEHNRKTRAKLLTVWQNPQFRETTIKAILRGLSIKPNKPEQQLISLIETNHLPFKYVGNGKFILGGKCPDFLNTNGKKQLIELFGTYWHSIFDVAKRTQHFRSYGFNTLVLWEDELGDEVKVLKKIKSFTRRRK